MKAKNKKEQAVYTQELEQFKDIRPFEPSELPQVYEELIADPRFRVITDFLLPGQPFEVIADRMRSCKTNFAFQKEFCYPFLKEIERSTSKGVLLDTSEITEKGKAMTFISNHRDIVLDSAFLSMKLTDQGSDTQEIAIGDNLLIYPWIDKVVRVNKSFVVRREVGVKETLLAARHLSAYVDFTVVKRNHSIWIAQRQGRAKDADDRTQESVIKMLAMADKENPVLHLADLNIIPLAISYEYDPCDYLKAMEAQQHRDIPDFHKSHEDDLKSMQTGLFGYKGRIYFRAAPSLSPFLRQMEENLPRQKNFSMIAKQIDKSIHSHFRMFPNNYMAYDLLYGRQTFKDHYNGEQRKEFEQYIDGQIARITLPNKDVEFLRNHLLAQYANPLSNYLAAINPQR